MKTYKYTFLMLLLAICSFTFGQVERNNEIEKSIIEVVGSAEKEIIPDEIYIAISIKERTNGREKISIDKQESDLKEALQSIGVPVENLALSDANASYIRVKWSRKDVITQSDYILKVNDALTVGKVFEQLDELKIEDAKISRVSHSKIEEFKKEVRIMAITAAKEKADYLLNAIGEERGKALKVYEQPSSYQVSHANLNVRGARSESSIIYVDGVKTKVSGQFIQFEKIKLQAAIYVKFEIK